MYADHVQYYLHTRLVHEEHVQFTPALHSLCAPQWVLCNITSTLELGDKQWHFN